MIRFIGAMVIAVFALPAWAEIKIQEVTSPGGIKAWLVEEHGIPFTALGNPVSGWHIAGPAR